MNQNLKLIGGRPKQVYEALLNPLLGRYVMWDFPNTTIIKNWQVTFHTDQLIPRYWHSTISFMGYIYIGSCSYESISHLTMRDRVGALTFKLLALDMDVRAPTLSLIVRWEMLLCPHLISHSKVRNALIRASPSVCVCGIYKHLGTIDKNKVNI